MRAAGRKPSRAALATLRRSLLATALMTSALSARPQEAGADASAPASPALDSLSLQRIEIAVARAQLELNQSDLLHRLMPRVHVTGSVGTDMVIPDELGSGITTARTAFRLTITIPLGEILNASRRNLAALDLARLECERDIAQARIRQRRTSDASRMRRLQAELDVLSETLGLKERIREYCRLRFKQGVASYAELSRAQIECLELEGRCDRLKMDIHELEGALR